MLELYLAEQCPYCVRVRLHLEERGLAYIIKPVPLGRGTNAHKEDLRQRGGKTQVPYLVDSEKKVEMYESADIIRYIDETYR